MSIRAACISSRSVTALLLTLCVAVVAQPAAATEDRIDDDAALVRYPLSTHGASGHSAANPIGATSRYTTRFRTFDGESLSIGYALERSASSAAASEFGISRAELDALIQGCVDSGRCDQAKVDSLTRRYYREHGLRMRSLPGEPVRLFVDVPQVVQRNRGRVQPVAAALRQVADAQGRDTEWIVDAAVALVQTGLAYRLPGTSDQGRRIAGFYPPPRALERGYGDCDTKAALLASILLNVTDTRMIGVHVPKHYLLGIAGTPQPGQAHIRHQGETYVLIETAGPALRPRGEIAETTQAALARGEGLRIDPIL